MTFRHKSHKHVSFPTASVVTSIAAAEDVDRTASLLYKLSCDMCKLPIPCGIRGYMRFATCPVSTCPDGFDVCAACAPSMPSRPYSPDYSPSTFSVPLHPHTLHVVDRGAECRWASSTIMSSTSMKRKTQTPTPGTETCTKSTFSTTVTQTSRPSKRSRLLPAARVSVSVVPTTTTTISTTSTTATEQPQPLSTAQLEEFHTHGYTVLRQAFDVDTATAVKTKIWERLEATTHIKKHDPNTWTLERVGLAESYPPTPGTLWNKCYPPRLRHAFDQLVGHGRWEESSLGMGWWVVSFPGFWDDALDEDPTLVWGAAGRWHVDGAHFQHYLDSKEVGLLPIFVFNHLEEHDGGTLLCPGSHNVVAQILHERAQYGDQQGMTGVEVSIAATERCDVKTNMIEIHGAPGDVVLCHPFMLHARSMNCGKYFERSVRPMCHPAIALKQEMNVSTAAVVSSSLLSPVERAIVAAVKLD